MKNLLIFFILFVVILFFLIYRKKNKQKNNPALIHSNNKEIFINLLKELIHEKLMFLCLNLIGPPILNFSFKLISDDSILVVTVNGKSQYINIEEEMKKVTFCNNGFIIYGKDLNKKIADIISRIE